MLKAQDFDCYASFHLEPLSGVLSAAKNIDRELVKKFLVGIVVEDVHSDTGLQIAAGKTLPKINNLSFLFLYLGNVILCRKDILQ